MKGYTFIDIVTTGTNPVLDKVIQISLTSFDFDMRPRKSFSTWINPKTIVSKAILKKFEITHKELQEFPDFSGVAPHIMPFLTNRILGTFEKTNFDVIEFLKEELFFAGIDFKYNKRDFILIKEIENHIFPNTLPDLVYRYTGQKSSGKLGSTKEMGIVFKHQCELIGEDTSKFNYYKKIKNNYTDYTERYLKEENGVLSFNFGRHTGKDINSVKSEYINWILGADFPISVKEKIKEYLK